jgi:tetratricopeptide (TPR) repeat protein
LKRSDPAAALHDLDEAIRLTGPSVSPRARARDHYERALVLYHQHRDTQALLACREALALAADDPAAHRLQGEIAMRLGCYQEALVAARGAAEEYTQALKWANDAETYAARGWACLDAEATRLALADFEQAIRLNAERGDSYNGRGLARVRLGDHHGAADAEAALRRGPASWQQCYNAARVFARAVGVVDATRPPGALQLLTRYQERTAACLRQALERYPPQGRASWASRILRDPAFLPVSLHPGFVRLLRDYPGDS